MIYTGVQPVFPGVLGVLFGPAFVNSGRPSTFGSRTNSPTSTVIMSRIIETQATGVIAITDGTGEYQQNGGAWVSTAGTVVPGDLIRARVTSSASYETAVTLEITIDGVADTFSVTTLAEVTSIWDDNSMYTDEASYTD